MKLRRGQRRIEVIHRFITGSGGNGALWVAVGINTSSGKLSASEGRNFGRGRREGFWDLTEAKTAALNQEKKQPGCLSAAIEMSVVLLAREQERVLPS
jgi:hypothetical protein